MKSNPNFIIRLNSQSALFYTRPKFAIILSKQQPTIFPQIKSNINMIQQQIIICQKNIQQKKAMPQLLGVIERNVQSVDLKQSNNQEILKNRLEIENKQKEKNKTIEERFQQKKIVNDNRLSEMQEQVEITQFKDSADQQKQFIRMMKDNDESNTKIQSQRLKKKSKEKKQKRKQQISQIDLQYRLYKATNYNKLIEQILKYNYQIPLFKSNQVTHIPYIFSNSKQYTQIFQNMIIDQCITKIYSQLQYCKTNPFSEKKIIQVNIKYNKKTQRNGSLFLISGNAYTSELSDKKSLIVLISAQKNIQFQNYSVTSYNPNQFLFIGYLSNHQRYHNLQCFLDEVEFIDLMGKQQKKVYMYEIDKISTTIKEFLAVRSIEFWYLCQKILNPSPTLDEIIHISKYKQSHQKNIYGALKYHYNQSQLYAICQISKKNNGIIPLIGPPGTGKTHTIMGLIASEYYKISKINKLKQYKIMVCAPSNTAVDNLIKKIVQQGLLNEQGFRMRPKLLRLGIIQSSDVSVRQISLNQLCIKQLQQNQKFRSIQENNITNLKIKKEILLKQIKKIINNQESKTILKEKQCEILKLQQKINSGLFKYNQKIKISDIEKQVIANSQIIFSTLASSDSPKLQHLKNKFTCLIVDQATQATQPNNLIPFKYNFKKVVLVGDPLQLPPTTFMQNSSENLYQRSLMERIIQCGVRPYFLNTQYRMTTQIRQIISEIFYSNRLCDHKNIKTRQYPKQLKIFEKQNIIFIDVKYGLQIKMDNSFHNFAQMEVIKQFLTQLNTNQLSVAIISPYRIQVKLLKQNLSNFSNITINTVDSFQGQQKDIIIISCVRSNFHLDKPGLGFLIDQRRLNVALTRAKYLVVVVGNADTLGYSQIWNYFLNIMELKKSYVKIVNRNNYQKVVQKLIKGQCLQEDRQVKRKTYKTLLKNNKSTNKIYEYLNDESVEYFENHKKCKKTEENLNKKELEIRNKYEGTNILDTIMNIDY